MDSCRFKFEQILNAGGLFSVVVLTYCIQYLKNYKVTKMKWNSAKSMFNAAFVGGSFQKVKLILKAAPSRVALVAAKVPLAMAVIKYHPNSSGTKLIMAAVC